MQARAARDHLGRVVVGAQTVPLEGARHLAAIAVHDRFDDVAGPVLVELHDELAQVGLDGLDAVALEEGAQLDLLGGHALGLHHALGAARGQDVEDGLAGRLGVGREVDLRAVRLQLRDRALEVEVQVLERVLLDRAGQAAQRVGLGVVARQRGQALVVLGLGA